MLKMGETHSSASTAVHPQQNQQVPAPMSITTGQSISTNELKSLYSKIQCARCCRFPKHPIPLSCNHIFCQQCINGMINADLTNVGKETSSQSTSSVASQGSQQSNNEPKISCTVCQKKFTVNEVTGINPNPALSQVTKFFDEVSEDRPMCSSCLNQRWIVHGSEYVFCQTCNTVVCPMCALDGHRSHKLQTNFESVFRSYREFGRKSANVKEEWINKLKTIEEAKLKSSRAKEKISQSKNELTKLSDDLDAKMAAINKLSDKLSSLEIPSYNERKDKLRMDTLRCFEQMVQDIRTSIEPSLAEINAKADALVKSEMYMAKAAELLKSSEEEKAESEIAETETEIGTNSQKESDNSSSNSGASSATAAQTLDDKS